MKQGIHFRNLLRRLPWDIILVYLVFNALVGVFGRIAFGRVETSVRNRTFDDLYSIVTLKSRQISDWLQDLRRIVSVPVQDEIYRLKERSQDPQSASLQAGIPELARQIDPTHRLAAVVLADEEGRPLASEPAELPLHPASLQEQVRSLLGVPWPRLSDLFLGPAGRVYLVVANPIAGIGTLALLVDAQRELYPMVREWPTTSRSAETLLVRREGDRVAFLNDLRFRKNSALSLTAPLEDTRLPASQALRRQFGVMQGVDYRGVRVLSAWCRVPGSTWSLVVKVDAAEVERSVRGLSLANLWMGIALGLASTLFLLLRLRQLVRHNRSEREALVSHYGYLTRYANDIILLLDVKGNIVEVNDRAAEAYGYSREELLSLSYRKLSGEATNPKPLNPGEGLVVESMHRRQDGTSFPVEASIRSIRINDQLYTQCILRDISERKKAEGEKLLLEGQLAEVRKQEAIAQLASGVAHDLNNALTAIQGYGELLRMKLPAEAGQRRPVEGILAAVARASRVTTGLLAFSEQQRLVWQPVELNALLCSSRPALESILGPGIYLEIRPHHEPLTVRGDGELLRQVLSRLAENAHRAMPRGGSFTVALEADRGRKNGMACLRVSDTGSGMSEEVRARLFEPFFTTQGFGRGAGLGLPIVYGIVRQHGGRIEVDSEYKRGTEFRVFLPLVQADAEG